MLVAGTALTAVAGIPGQSPEVDTVEQTIVGDLRLADHDEGPSDGVERTFAAETLAPGDRFGSQLASSREAHPDLGAAIRPNVTINLSVDRGQALAGALIVDELRYGDRDPLGKNIEWCGPLHTSRAGGELPDDLPCVASPDGGRCRWIFVSSTNPWTSLPRSSEGWASQLPAC